jgi:hypothetical protein
MIYTTFKQWVKGRFLETGEPRKKAYSKDEFALIEMGWGYGYDAGVEWQKRQTALDKKADNARDLGLDYEPVIAIANQAIEEVAQEIEKFKGFGDDTIASFTVYIRNMKR